MISFGSHIIYLHRSAVHNNFFQIMNARKMEGLLLSFRKKVASELIKTKRIHHGNLLLEGNKRGNPHHVAFLGYNAYKL